MTEAKFQQECFMWHWNTYPNERGRLYMNYNNPKNKAHGAVLKGMGLMAGVADLSYLCDGKMVYIELKTDKGIQSDKQKDFELLAIELGHEYHICRDLEHFKRIIQKT